MLANTTTAATHVTCMRHLAWRRSIIRQLTRYLLITSPTQVILFHLLLVVGWAQENPAKFRQLLLTLIASRSDCHTSIIRDLSREQLLNDDSRGAAWAQVVIRFIFRR